VRVPSAFALTVIAYSSVRKLSWRNGAEEMPLVAAPSVASR
jgi:hypothetical protein